jgi:carbon storage regulator CsrA
MSETYELVISRREGEAVVIGDPRSPSARVTIVSIKGTDRVRVSIRADRGTPIHRAEVADHLGDEDGDGLVTA